MPKIVATKTAWIKLGFELFAKYGVSGIVVERMADKLNCNRSSFYWHFNSQKGFIDEVIEHWIETDTNRIISLAQNAGSPEEQFRVLIEAVLKKDPNIDFVFHLKRYALKQEEIQKTIDNIDQRRIEYVTSLLKDLDHSAGDAPVKANILYKYIIGYHEMNRYKKQERNYVEQVYAELRHFLSI